MGARDVLLNTLFLFFFTFLIFFLEFDVAFHELGHWFACFLTGGYGWLEIDEKGWATKCILERENILFYISGILFQLFLISILYSFPITRGIAGIMLIRFGIHYYYGAFLVDMQKAGLMVLYSFIPRLFVLSASMTLGMVGILHFLLLSRWGE